MMKPSILWKHEGKWGPAYLVSGDDYSPLFDGKWVTEKEAERFANKKHLEFDIA